MVVLGRVLAIHAYLAAKKDIWRLPKRLQEGHKQPLYCVSFNYCSKEHRDLFATTGTAQATVYRCHPDGRIAPILALKDADDEEEFYVCRWSIDTATGAPLLLLAGKNALLRVFNVSTGQLVTTFEGHGQSINDIAVHPTHPHLVVTAAKDHCLRLWNLRSRTCVLVFEGAGGHRGEVLTVDWRLPQAGASNGAANGSSSVLGGGGSDLVLVSGGMDNRVKIWDLEAYKGRIEASERWSVASGRAFLPAHVAQPVANIQGVHWNYVDCVRWLGPALLSKSVSDCIECWVVDSEVAARDAAAAQRREGDPLPGQEETPVRGIATFHLEDTRDVWWMRFGIDFRGRLLAQGTSKGQVLLFSLDPMNSEAPVARLRPKRTKDDSSRLLVRQAALSFDGTCLVAAHEDGSITRWDWCERNAGGGG